MANLNSTTLSAGIAAATDGLVCLASVANIAKGDLIVPVSPDGFAHEAMTVLETPVSGLACVRVARGAAGTRATRHQIGLTVYTGSPYLFASDDPMGIPLAFPVANPRINLANGRVWFAEGSQIGNTEGRFWQLLTPAPILNNAGPLGIQSNPALVPAS